LPAHTKERVLGHIASLPHGDRLLHLDFHPRNIVVSTAGLHIIDWDGACAGEPLADVARSCLILMLAHHYIDARSAAVLDTFRTSYLQCYLGLTGASPAAVDSWLPALAAARTDEGFPGEHSRLLALIESGWS
jgi:thiamine kinase-like enzyme